VTRIWPRWTRPGGPAAFAPARPPPAAGRPAAGRCGGVKGVAVWSPKLLIPFLRLSGNPSLPPPFLAQGRNFRRERRTHLVLRSRSEALLFAAGRATGKLSRGMSTLYSSRAESSGCCSGSCFGFFFRLHFRRGGGHKHIKLYYSLLI
jgi:hypothetical protein